MIRSWERSRTAGRSEFGAPSRKAQVPMFRSLLSQSYTKARRWQIVAVAAVAVTVVGVGLGLGVASASAAVPTVNCPRVKVDVAVPSQAQAEVKSNLALLNKQI